jgi:ribosomal protein S18 acetylase RimI-like enzyme
MHIRTAEISDIERIEELYKAVARAGAGIARSENEITQAYVEKFVSRSLGNGLILVAENPSDPDQLIGEVHAYKAGIEVFDHMLTNLTIVVHPEFQGNKIGRTIFTIFQEEIATNRPDVGRVELFTRESNTKAIKFYESIGFRIEGRLEMRIRTPDKNYEADIPMSWLNPNFEFD